MIPWVDLAVLGLAAARITRLVGVDDFPPIRTLREKLLGRFPSGDTVWTEQPDQPETVWVAEVGWVAVEPHWLGELIVCPWCTGFWISVAAVVAYGYAPGPVVWISLPFAISHLIGLIHRP